MTEIHAYKNPDGTYRVEILDTKHIIKQVGKHKTKEITEYKAEIPRAIIDIAACQSNYIDTPTLTLMVDEENDQ